MIRLRRTALSVFWLQVIEGVEEKIFTSFVTEIWGLDGLLQEEMKIASRLDLTQDGSRARAVHPSSVILVKEIWK
jgi:hypothetical protein